MTRLNPSHNSHTHCQVAQAEAQAKTWQRVCLSNRTTDRQTDEKKEALGGNITYTQAGVSCFVGQESSKIKVQFFVGSSVVKIPACV
ncbi:hypothetical protein Aoki45_24060 [Algoriphagus sp. oki45]|nr:hypothetical protein Aoki45_24060 [Algoriphagus sp. oki45]